MPEFSDPFAEIVAGLEFDENGLKEYETVPPDRVALLQQGLLDHMVALDTGEKLEGVALEVHLARLQQLYEMEFEKLDVLKSGDRIRLSQAGILMSIDSEGNFGIEVLDHSVYVTGEIIRPIIMDTPLTESLGINGDEPEEIGSRVVMQLSACVQLFDVAIGVNDADMYHEERLEDSQLFVCVPFTDPAMKVQRLVTHQ